MITEIGKDIAKAVDLLMDNQLVAIPTETVYGLAANALNTDAVIKIFEAKNRPTFNPLIVHVPNLEAAQKYTEEWHPKLIALAQKFCPGAITFLVSKKNIIPDLVTAGSDRVAIRIPNHEKTLALLETLPFPLAAPSANPFGYVSPVTPEHVLQGLGGKIPYILDGGNCDVGIESTIVGMENQEVVVYRLGGIDLEQMEEVIEKITKIHVSSSKPEAPGMLIQHYAPNQKIILGNSLEANIKKYPDRKFGVISFGTPIQFEPEMSLSLEGNINEAAKNLFSVLRKCEEWKVDAVFVQFLPEIGLGKAINDRLRRAAFIIEE